MVEWVFLFGMGHCRSPGGGGAWGVPPRQPWTGVSSQWRCSVHGISKFFGSVSTRCLVNGGQERFVVLKLVQ